jgi:hypothetical protein
MPAAQVHLTGSTPMGCTLVGDGVTLRFWVPQATRVLVA